MFDALNPSLVSMETTSVKHVTSFPVVRDIPDSNHTHRHANTQGFRALKIEARVILQQRNACLAKITVGWFIEVMHTWWITKHCFVTSKRVFTLLRWSKEATMVHCSWQFPGNMKLEGGQAHVCCTEGCPNFKIATKCCAIRYQRLLYKI